MPDTVKLDDVKAAKKHALDSEYSILIAQYGDCLYKVELLSTMAKELLPKLKELSDRATALNAST